MLDTILKFLILNIVYYACSCQSPDEIKERSNNSGNDSTNCSNGDVEIRLSEYNAQRSDGLLLVRLPGATRYAHVCRPPGGVAGRREAALAHAVCRQRGFTSYASLYEQALPGGNGRALLARSAGCRGFEPAVALCPWREVAFAECEVVLGVRCGACNTVIRAQSGILHNPGYPHAYLYACTCEWLLVAPVHQVLHLTFQKMLLPLAVEASATCGGTEPYVEVTYGFPGSQVVKRFCRHNSIENLTVSYSLAQVRFFSGLHFDGAEEDSEQYGFSLAFQAIPEHLPPSQPLRIVAGAVGFVIFALAIIGCYCCRKWEQTSRPPPLGASPLAPNAPTREQVQFHRCGQRVGQPQGTTTGDGVGNFQMQDMSVSHSCTFHSREISTSTAPRRFP